MLFQNLAIPTLRAEVFASVFEIAWHFVAVLTKRMW